MPVTVADIRVATADLPRSYEVVVRDRLKWRVGRIVYLALSLDETVLGFAFPREEREALVASDPETFLMPTPSDMRYQWVQLRMAVIDARQLREIVLDAWAMVVPKSVARAVLAQE
jgi:hypothetical protein